MSLSPLTLPQRAFWGGLQSSHLLCSLSLAFSLQVISVRISKYSIILMLDSCILLNNDNLPINIIDVIDQKLLTKN